MRWLWAIALLLTLAAGCQSEPPRISRDSGLVNELPAPAYHSPEGWWRANHGALVKGPWSQRPWTKPGFQWQECAFCHQVEHSCDACHRYLGRDGLTQDLTPPGAEM